MGRVPTWVLELLVAEDRRCYTVDHLVIFAAVGFTSGLIIGGMLVFEIASVLARQP